MKDGEIKKSVTESEQPQQKYRAAPEGFFFKPTRFNATMDVSDAEYALLAAMPSLNVSSNDNNNEESLLKPQGSEAFEHRAIGNKGFNAFLGGIPPSEQKALFDELKLNGYINDKKEIRLNPASQFLIDPGAIVALAGDFFADPEKPICFGKDQDERRSRFIAAYQKLVEANSKRIADLLEVVEVEEKIATKAFQDGKSPSVELKKISSEHNKKYGNITGYNAIARCTFFPGTFLHSEYIDIASMNYDHFGEMAKEAFEAGFEEAMKVAQWAHKMKGTKQGLELLVRAFTMILFACHFYTDAFAAGHVRVPRKEILEHITEKDAHFVPFQAVKSGIAGLLVKQMHDEDGKLGLDIMSNKHPQEWRSYGDRCYFEVDNVENADKTVEAVAAVLNEIYQTYKTGVATKEYVDYWPQLKDSTNNHWPMFRYNQNTKKVEARVEITDVNCSVYTDDWDPKETLYTLMKRPANPYPKQDPSITKSKREQLEKELKAELEDLFDNDDDARIECTLS